MLKLMESKSEREKEIWRLVEGLSKTFIQRQDIYARQLDDGRYVLVNQRYSYDLMYRHLQGKITLGAYLLDVNGQARFTVLDVDDDKGFAKLKALSGDLGVYDVPSYLEKSRRGGHMWVFFDQSQPAKLARNFGLGLLDVFGIKKAEVYPKQEELTEGPGSLIRVPFGIHRKSGQRYGFVNPDGHPLGSWREQAEALIAHAKVSTEVVLNFQYQEKPKAPHHQLTGNYERLKDIPLVDFIGQFVELRQIASGAIGRCPFHDDQTPSFGVNKKGNYWNCFAGCGGGDIISFWMKWKGVDFKTAVTELEKMIGK